MLRHIAIKQFKGLESVELTDCGPVNAIIGKNNSGKTSVLHAIDMAGLALNVGNWNSFEPKVQIKDLFSRVGEFAIDLTYLDNNTLQITSSPSFGPTLAPQPANDQKFETLLIIPDVGLDINRRAWSPVQVMDYLKNRDYSNITALDMLYCIKFYGQKNQRDMTPKSYSDLIAEIKRYFPDLEDIESSKNERDIATLDYTEYGKKLDIIYSGTGLRHFLDVLVKTTISGAKVVLIDEPEIALHPDLQRRFIEYLGRIAKDKHVQFFLATHSPVLLKYPDVLTYFRILNKKGRREISRVAKEAVHTLMSDLGIRPSDVFNKDICVLVEGQTDVIYMEHIIEELYKDEFEGVDVGVQQYAGGAADGIISGSINVSNITPVQKYVLWIRDRDEPPKKDPSTEAMKFRNKLEQQGHECHILEKREIEYYFQEEVHVVAQQGDGTKEAATQEILNGSQEAKYTTAAEPKEVCVPTGIYLRRLLKKHLTSCDQLHEEIRQLVETTLIPWKKEILGD